MLTSLLDSAVAIALERMQRPTGQALITVGRGMQSIGKEVEQLGHELVKTAPTPVTTRASGA